jgi:hypothetical protein
MLVQSLWTGLVGVTVTLLLAGCLPATATAPSPPPTLTPHPTDAPIMTASPTLDFSRYCVGWQCTLEGVVYGEDDDSNNRLEGASVHLHQHSYCSPTAGEHDTITGADGTFQFAVYVHDTDTFRIEVTAVGYEPMQHTLGGFDCLYCSCPLIEVVLNPLK